MGQRSRKSRPATRRAETARGDDTARRADAAQERRDAMAERYARSRARDEAIRASLVPLAPGERPRAVTVAAIFAAIVAAANLIAGILSSPTGREWGTLAFQCAVLVVAAVGMWRVKYWAVLGFQVLLGISVLLAFLALLRAADAWAVILVLLVITICSAQFWFLIRAMARIQMPERARQDAPPR